MQLLLLGSCLVLDDVVTHTKHTRTVVCVNISAGGVGFGLGHNGPFFSYQLILQLQSQLAVPGVSVLSTVSSPFLLASICYFFLQSQNGFSLILFL